MSLRLVFSLLLVLSIAAANVERAAESETVSKTVCVDSGTYCQGWASQGYCANPNYPEAEKRAKCCHTCNLASVNTEILATTKGTKATTKITLSTIKGTPATTKKTEVTTQGTTATTKLTKPTTTGTIPTKETKTTTTTITPPTTKGTTATTKRTTPTTKGTTPTTKGTIATTTPTKSTTKGVETTGSICIDKSRDCPKWASNGFCDHPFYTADFRNTTCCHSCKLGKMTFATKSTTKRVETTPATCIDKSRNCPKWASNGFCDHPFYTADFRKTTCCHSCKLSDAAKERTTTKPTTTCEDSYASCPTWKFYGFCTSPLYTISQKKHTCCNSCRLGDVTASKPETSCVDSYAQCPTWKSNGFCSSPEYTTYQKKHSCCKSCGLENVDVTTEPKTACVDSDRSCPLWKANGFCDHPSYSRAEKKTYCCKTCGFE